MEPVVQWIQGTHKVKTVDDPWYMVYKKDWCTKQRSGIFVHKDVDDTDMDPQGSVKMFQVQACQVKVSR